MLIKILPVFLTSVVISFLIVVVILNPIIRLITIFVVPTIVALGVAYKFVLADDEKRIILGIVKRFLMK